MGAVAQRRQVSPSTRESRGRAGFLAAGGGVFGAASPAAVNGRSAAQCHRQGALQAVLGDATARRQTSRAR